MSGFFTGVKRWVLWDFKRGSLQYDVMVALILAFIFLTPRSFFRDEPRNMEAVQVSRESQAAVFWIESSALSRVGPEGLDARVAELVQAAAKDRRYQVDRLEPVPASGDDIRGYMAYASAVE
jgi:hypothetical protein